MCLDFYFIKPLQCVFLKLFLWLWGGGSLVCRVLAKMRKVLGSSPNADYP